MLYPYKIVEEVVDFLRENIEDIDKERSKAGKEWIHKDFPRIDSKMPRAGVFLVGEPIMVRGLNGSIIANCRMQITLVINSAQKFDINNDNEPEHAEECIDYLANQIVQKIRENLQYFKEKHSNLIHIIPTSINVTRRGELIYRYIDLEAMYEYENV